MLIMRKFEFDAAHRVLNHESKCKFIHGHRYVAEVYVSAPKLDSIGRVIDFGIVKDRIGKWIDSNWDHTMILNIVDPIVQLWRDHPELSSGQTAFVMVGNPTAENMAELLFSKATELLPEVTVEKVRIWETPNCFAEFTGTAR